MNLDLFIIHFISFLFYFFSPTKILPIISGTGKTATFSISILQQVDQNVKECQALILAPTRELAQQIQKVIIFLVIIICGTIFSLITTSSFAQYYIVDMIISLLDRPLVMWSTKFKFLLPRVVVFLGKALKDILTSWDYEEVSYIIP